MQGAVRSVARRPRVVGRANILINSSILCHTREIVGADMWRSVACYRTGAEPLEQMVDKTAGY